MTCWKKVKFLFKKIRNVNFYKETGNRIADGLAAFASGGSKASTGGAGTAGSGAKPKQPAPSTLPVPKKKPGEKSTELWTDLYAPKDVSEIVGNQNFIKDIMTWLQDW